MRERYVVICNVVEEMDLILLEQQTGGNGVHGRVSPSLVEKSAILVETLEEISVCFGSKPI